MSVSVRLARVSDLPSIHNLIRESFLAMSPHSCLGDKFWLRSAENLIRDELNPKVFESTYLTSGGSGSSCFWVAEESPGGVVVGCVGVKECRKTPYSMELVRMAASKSKRGQGVGSALILRLLNHVENITPTNDVAVCRIHLTTANPLSAKFYQKHGFRLHNRLLYYQMDREVVKKRETVASTASDNFTHVVTGQI